MYVVDASVEKRKPDVIIEDVFEMNRRLKRDCKKGFYKFGVEVVQFQYFFKEVMAAKSAEEGEYIPIEEIQSTSDSGGGSYAQSKTHNEVRHDLTVADAKSLAVTIRRDIIRPLVEFNYGSEANIPFFGFDCHEVEDQKEVVEIYKTLACDMGLEIPKSHIYKKFNIPKPENGEEVLKPPQAGMMTAQQQPMETTEELKLKQEEGQAEQRQVDTIVSIANKQSEDIFREMMKPIFKMIDKAEDMDELQKVLKDEKKLRELYQDMESPELEDLIQQGIYLSHLIGRSMD